MHLLLPDADLAFVTDGGALPFPPTRTIRLDAMVPAERLRPLRGRLRLLRRMEDALLEDAVSQIAAAHALHDRMEDIYRPHIDLDAMGSFIFQRIDGQRTVGDIALLVKAEFGQKAEPLYDRLVKYMQILRNNGFIRYAGKDRK